MKGPRHFGRARRCLIYYDYRAVVRSTFSVGLFYGAVEKVALEMKQHGADGALKNFIIGAFSRGIATFLTMPLTVLKTRLEASHSRPSIRVILRSIYLDRGLIGFYRGMGATLLRDCPYQGIQFILYNYLLQLDKILLNRGSLVVYIQITIRRRAVILYLSLEGSVQYLPLL